MRNRRLDPPAAGRRAGRPGETPARPLPVQSRGRVLVAEDEPTVRNVAKDVSAPAGYRRARGPRRGGGAGGGRGHGGIVDLLLTDVVMPNLGGRELAARLLVERPGVRVLFMSGYPNDARELGALAGSNRGPPPEALLAQGARRAGPRGAAAVCAGAAGRSLPGPSLGSPRKDGSAVAPSAGVVWRRGRGGGRSGAASSGRAARLSASARRARRAGDAAASGGPSAGTSGSRRRGSPLRRRRRATPE